MNEKIIWDRLKPYLEEEHPCIICSKGEFSSWAQEQYLEAKLCNNCGMISTNPHFSEKGLEIFYSEYLPNRLKNRQLMEQREEAYIIDRDWVSNFINGGEVLDIGCSGGFFLSKFSSSLWDREGIEIGANNATYAQDNYGIHVYTGMVTSIKFPKCYDLVMMRGVIEHLRDPIDVLKKCYKIVKPGGYLYITAMPTGDCFAFYIYREKWRQFTPLEHIHFFSRKLMTRIVEEIGFRFICHHYQYDETPYANPREDYDKMKKDINLISNGRKEDISISPPFPGTMLTVLYQKI